MTYEEAVAFLREKWRQQPTDDVTVPAEVYDAYAAGVSSIRRMPMGIGWPHLMAEEPSLKDLLTVMKPPTLVFKSMVIRRGE